MGGTLHPAGNECAALDLVIGMGSRWTDHGGDDVHGQNRGNPSAVWLDQSDVVLSSVHIVTLTNKGQAFFQAVCGHKRSVDMLCWP